MQLLPFYFHYFFFGFLFLIAGMVPKHFYYPFYWRVLCCLHSLEYKPNAFLQGCGRGGGEIPFWACSLIFGNMKYGQRMLHPSYLFPLRKLLSYVSEARNPMAQRAPLDRKQNGNRIERKWWLMFSSITGIHWVSRPLTPSDGLVSMHPYPCSSGARCAIRCPFAWLENESRPLALLKGLVRHDELLP